MTTAIESASSDSDIVPSATSPELGDTPAVRKWLFLRLVGGAVVFIWFGALVGFSTLLYHRFFLTEDFGAYNQAWSLIGQGHLNPFETIFQGYPFYKSDLELIIWPLALIHLVFPHPIVLLWLQDLAIAGTGLVVFLWVLDFLQRRRVGWGLAVGVSSIVLLMWIANPSVYETLSFDFHVEPISTFFLVMAGWSLWRGRFRQSWIWIALTLLCGTFATITVVGLGVSAILAGSMTRRRGVLIVLCGVAWLGVISVIGANTGAGLSNYAYLAGRTNLPTGTGVALVIAGILTHPTRALHVLHDRLHYVYTLIKPVGVVGGASAWGFGVPVVVMMVNGLNSSYEFIYQSFQNFPVFPFTLLGTVMVLVWFTMRFRFGWIPALAVALAVLVQALDYGITTSPGHIRWASSQITAAQGAELHRALTLTPPKAEVIATIGIIGRFSARPWVYWFRPNSPIPVHTRRVEFVFFPGIEHEIPEANAADDIAAEAFVSDHLRAHQVVNNSGIVAFDWLVPSGTPSVSIPTR